MSMSSNCSRSTAVTPAAASSSMTCRGEAGGGGATCHEALTPARDEVLRLVHCTSPSRLQEHCMCIGCDATRMAPGVDLYLSLRRSSWCLLLLWGMRSCAPHVQVAACSVMRHMVSHDLLMLLQSCRVHTPVDVAWGCNTCLALAHGSYGAKQSYIVTRHTHAVASHVRHAMPASQSAWRRSHAATM